MIGDTPEATRDALYSEISDTHKDLYGMRCRFDPSTWTIAELAEYRDSLVLELCHELQAAREEQAADEAAQRFYREPIPMATLGQLIAGRA